jgi:hypothetical protein
MTRRLPTQILIGDLRKRIEALPEAMEIVTYRSVVGHHFLTSLQPYDDGRYCDMGFQPDPTQEANMLEYTLPTGKYYVASRKMGTVTHHRLGEPVQVPITLEDFQVYLTQQELDALHSNVEPALLLKQFVLKLIDQRRGEAVVRACNKEQNEPVNDSRVHDSGTATEDKGGKGGGEGPATEDAGQ